MFRNMHIAGDLLQRQILHVMFLDERYDMLDMPLFLGDGVLILHSVLAPVRDHVHHLLNTQGHPFLAKTGRGCREAMYIGQHAFEFVPIGPCQCHAMISRRFEGIQQYRFGRLRKPFADPGRIEMQNASDVSGIGLNIRTMEGKPVHQEQIPGFRVKTESPIK